MRSNCFRDIVFGVGKEVEENELTIYSDCAIAACILHDCCKAEDDDPKHKTLFDHPVLAANLLKETAKKHITKENNEYMKTVIPLIYNAIARHMGKWNEAVYAKGIVLPIPKTGLDVFVHLCDYLASRKFLDMNFEVYDNN